MDPIVTASLVGAGKDPRITLGPVNRAELFLSILDATVKVISTGSWPCHRQAGSRTFFRLHHEALKAKTLLMPVGALISCISAFNLYKIWVA